MSSTRKQVSNGLEGCQPIGRKVKRLGHVRRGASPRPIDDPIYFDDEGTHAWVRIADVTASARYLESTTQRLSDLGKSKSVALEPGALFVSIAATVGKPIITKIKCCIHDGFVHFVELRQNRDYLYYALSCGEPYRGLGKLGTQLNLNTDTIGNIDMPVPPATEQAAIVAFLDRETIRIDSLISKKKRLISLLEEKRSALIARALTKGVETDTPMKDSGIDWLGAIPANWHVRRIKYLLRRIVDTEHKTAPFYPDGEFLVVRTSNVSRGGLDLSDAKFTDRAGYEGWTRRATPSPGDILFTREAPAGEACVVPTGMSVCLGQRMVLLKVDDTQLNGRFGVSALYGPLASEFVATLSQGSTVAHFNMGDIGNIPLLVPPVTDQIRIVEFLDQRVRDLDALIAKANAGMARLMEFRTSLISAAVTGQVDTRNAEVSAISHT